MIRTILLLFTATILFGCQKQDPIVIGFVGGLTGSTSDLGSHSRNGMILAIEQWNEKGGLHKQPIQYIIENDKQDNQVAIAAVSKLIEVDVDAIIGPSTSSMAVQVSQLATEANIPMFGTTVTTNQLSKIDDQFFRSVAATANSSQHFTQYLLKNENYHTFAIVTDLSNKAYTESWKYDFVNQMTEGNRELVSEYSFSSGDNIALLDISQQLALLDTDLIVLVTNAIDAALLIKQIRSIDEDVGIATSEWAGTNQLIQLSGTDSEGILVPRYIDQSGGDPGLIELNLAYKKRFQQDLGYPALLGYNATNVLLDAIKNKTKDQSVKQYLLEKRIFEGVLATFELDEYGDEKRNAFHFITQIKNRKFITLKE